MQAPVWDLLFERGGHRMYIDRASDRDLGGGVREAWFKVELPGKAPAQNGWPRFRSSLELRRYDCARGTSGTVRMKVFASRRAEGEPLRDETKIAITMEPAQPGSIGDAVLRALCSRSLH